MTAINLSARIRFVNDDGTLTQEAYRSLTEIINRTGGVLGNSGADTFVSNDFSSVEGQQGAGGDITGDTFSAAEAQAQALGEMVMQPTASQSSAQTTSSLPPAAVSVAASPFTYSPAADGFLIVAGGTVTKQEYKRGAVFTDVGQLNSMLLVLSGDALRVTYTAAPTITFIPR